MKNTQRLILALALSLSSACGGGGGGGGSSAVAPTNLVYAHGTQAWMTSVAATSDTPTFAGSPSTFSIVPALPAGVAIDLHTGAISGTATAASPMTSYVVKASNSGGFTTTVISIATSLAPRFAYVVNQSDSTITVFSEDATTGALDDVGYVLAPGGQTGPERMVVHPSGKFAYVSNMGSSNLSVYTVQVATGWLSPGIAIALGAGPHHVAIDPSGQYLYATSQNSNQLQVFSISSVTGALGFVQSIATGVQPSACVVDPGGKFLFVTLHGDPTTGQGSAVQSYAIDAPTGSVTALPPAVSLNGSQPTDIVVDPSGKTLFTTGEKFNFVIPVNYDGTTGALTVLTARHSGVRPRAIASDATGRFVYVTNETDGSVSCYSADPTTGNLTLSGTVTTGASPTAIAPDAGGRFMYILSSGAQSVSQFAIDDVTGLLTAGDSLATRATPSGMAFGTGSSKLALVPKFVHVAASTSNEAPAYGIATPSGGLTELPNPAGTGTRPVSAASDPKHRFLYVANQISSTIDSFTINSTTGALTQVGLPDNVTGVPTHVVVEPSGRFLYVTTRDAVNANDGWVTTWVINQNDGSITPLDTHQVADLALWALTDPTGSYLYVASKTTVQGGAKITLLSINPVDGTLTPSANPPAAASGCVALGYHPKMRVVYSVLATANAIVSFAADATTGELTVIPGGAGNSGLSPSSIAIAPNGKFAYVSYLDPAGTGHVSEFSVNPANGKLVVPAVQYADGLHPSDLAMTRDGKFLYVANSGSNTISVFQADPATGVLVAQPAAASGLEPNAVVVTTTTQ